MFFRIIEYIRYFFKAKSQFGIHAPFAFEFYTKVIRPGAIEEERFSEIEALRKSLLNSAETILVKDLGTGAKSDNQLRKVSLILRRYANDQKDALLLYRMIRYLQPSSILELGTSLGFTTMYMAKAAGDATVFTIEGCPETARMAKQNFDKIGLNIELIVGNIDQILPDLLKKNFKPSFVFFDGNHTREATLRYFALCCREVDENSVFVFDDIYWSAGMKEAWQTIISHPEVVLSIDLFRVGLVFFKKNSAKQHFVLKY